MVDQAARQKAIDPRGSYIVQAPAGSGKTELLIQRYLGLLAQVNNPEEILAITFTRKATEEMRTRISDALLAAREAAPKELQDHERLTRQLAKAVLAQDQKLGWQLLEFPRRLRISTIDAFCANLVRQMPFLSRMGSFPDLLDPAGPIYARAIEKLLAQAHGNHELGNRLSALLDHLDNDWRKISGQLERALANRDQWMNQVITGRQDPKAMRAAMTTFLKEQVERKMQELLRLVGGSQWHDLRALARYAEVNGGKHAWWPAFAAVEPHEPQVAIEDFVALKNLIFTKTGTFRSAPNKNWGFPSKAAAQLEGTDFTSHQEVKDAYISLVASLKKSGFTRALEPIDEYPPPGYEDEQWLMVETLMEVFFYLVAYLREVNKETSQVDYVEMSLAALWALGSSDAPTDLLLTLDHQIQHILIDEFQDTSKAQVSLLTNLVAGWMPGDGRSLFVVGDPMQSIYAFRKADVGNFLRARRGGVGEVALEPLRLERNFRSEPEIVHWVNQVFPEVFPKEEDVILGQVSYSASVAKGEGENKQRVFTHLLETKSREVEAVRALDIIQKRLEEGLPSGEQIAVLVRSRTHLQELIPMLQSNNIRFAAVDIFRLEHEALIQDLQALATVMHRSYDEISWLACLRSPLCGLSLTGLTQISSQPPPLYSDKIEAALSENRLQADDHERLKIFQQKFLKHLALRTEKSVRALVEGLFYELGGPGLYDAQEQQGAELFFQLLEKLEASEGGFAPDGLKKHLSQLKAPSHDVNAPVQLMTLHKSKGLEFDTVLLFAMGEKPVADDYELLSHFEWRVSEREEGLLMAPIKKTGDDPDPIQKFIRHLRKKQDANELQRLLYVGATRAKRYLHVIGAGTRNKDDTASFIKGSFLELLGPHFEQFQLGALEKMPAKNTEVEDELPWLRRAQRLQDVPLPQTVGIQPLVPERQQKEKNIYNASVMARHVGTVIHQYLEWMGEEALKDWDEARINSEKTAIKNQLLVLGTSLNDIDLAQKRVMDALVFVLEDQRGQWILAEHTEAKSEWALSLVSANGQIKNYVVDRTFVDEKGVRWIIDYKTGLHQGGDLEGYLENKQAEHLVQLENYAKIFRALEDRPISMGLYFPFEGGWRHWDWNEANT